MRVFHLETLHFREIHILRYMILVAHGGDENFVLALLSLFTNSGNISAFQKCYRSGGLNYVEAQCGQGIHFIFFFFFLQLHFWHL